MTSSTINPANAGVAAAQERERVAHLLARYPDLTDSEFDELRNWFDRIATPLDFGLLAGDPAVAVQYRAYRAEHHDRFKPKDIGIAVVFLGAVLAVVGLVLAMKP